MNNNYQKIFFLLIESLGIGFSLSSIPEINILGIFPAIVVFAGGLIQNHKVNILITCLAILTAAPRLSIIVSNIESKKKETYSVYTAKTKDCLKNYPYHDERDKKNKCLEDNKVEEQKEEDSKKTIITNSKDFTIFENSIILLYAFLSITIPLIIYFLNDAERYSKRLNQEQEFRELFENNIPKLEIMKKLNIKENKYYSLRKGIQGN